ncbi:hypothetical protein [Streptomyces sp. NBC_01481]|uniref:hypothetical protein n=1 Tax=Streptomyces sp. NBC_01481 TaxID=2975869 RepID=UPI00225273ED|nr:hypothetical protein [Streptomyces sp. NBC_01481]MCX4588054.1 hypothetical protein [Streptomyces sp. NBC_01481]
MLEFLAELTVDVIDPEEVLERYYNQTGASTTATPSAQSEARRATPRPAARGSQSMIDYQEEPS